MIRWLTGTLLPVVGLVLATGAGGARAQSPPAASPSAAEPLAAAWSHRIPDLYEVAISPNGDRVLAVDSSGLIRAFDEAGKPLWTHQAPGVDRVAVSRGGALSVAYAVNHYLKRQVHFLNARGRRFATFELDTPVRSVTVAPDGRFAAIAAGRSVVFCVPTEEGIRRRIIPLDGEATQLHFGPGDALYVASRSTDSVRLVKSTGRVLWEYAPAGTSGYSICASEDGRAVAIAGQRASGAIEVSLFRSDGSRSWTVTRPGRGAKIRLAASGTAVLLSYEHQSEHDLQRQFERRLAYFSHQVEPSWTKGGAYTAPLFVSVDREGDWVVGLDTQQQVSVPRFRLYGKGGERRWIHTAPAPVLIALSSAQGRHIVVYHTNEVLQLLKVNQR